MGTQQPAGKQLVTISDLYVSFPTREGNVQALNGVTLTLHEGERVALVGESGSGKSVLGLSLLRLLPEGARTTGSIVYQGVELTSLTEAEMRAYRGRRIGLIGQNPATSLNPVYRIGVQVRGAIEAGRRFARRSQIRARMLELLRKFGFANPERIAYAYPFELSGGMKQRALAAIGSAGEPELLVADEPTKGLDAVVRSQVVEVLAEAADANCALLLITHDLQVAERVSERIGVMYAGELVESRHTSGLFYHRGPKHPYTEGFLNASPRRGLKAIPGHSPSLTALPSGCAFHPRCPYALPRCSKEKPPSFPVEGENESFVRCWLYDC